MNIPKEIQLREYVLDKLSQSQEQIVNRVAKAIHETHAFSVESLSVLTIFTDPMVTRLVVNIDSENGMLILRSTNFYEKPPVARFYTCDELIDDIAKLEILWQQEMVLQIKNIDHQSVHLIRTEEPPQTTVSFSVHAKNICRALTDHRGSDKATEAITAILTPHLIELIRQVEHHEDFIITVTHVINESTTVTSNHSPNCQQP